LKRDEVVKSGVTLEIGMLPVNASTLKGVIALSTVVSGQRICSIDFMRAGTEEGRGKGGKGVSRSPGSSPFYSRILFC